MLPPTAQDSDPEIRLKLPIFRVQLLLTLGLGGFVLVWDTLTGSYGQLPFSALMLAAAAAGWFGLRRWGYPRVSLLFTFFIILIELGALSNLGYRNEHSFFFAASILVVLLLVGGLFLSRFHHLAMLVAGLWGFNFFFLFRAFWRGQVTTKVQTLDDQLVTSVLMLLLGTVLVLLTRFVFDKVLADLTREAQARQRGQESLGQLVRGLAHHLNTPLGNAKMVLSMAEPDPEGPAVLKNSVDTSVLLVQRMSGFMRLCEHAPWGTLDGPGLKSLVVGRADRPPEWRTTEAFDRAFQQEQGQYWEVIAFALDQLVENGWVHGNGERPVVTAHRTAEELVLTVENRGRPLSAEQVHQWTDPFFSTLVSGDHPGLGLYFVTYLTSFILIGRFEVLPTADGTSATLAVPLARPTPSSRFIS